MLRSLPVVLALLLAPGACSGSGGEPSRPSPTAPATVRTIVTFGPDAAMVVEIVRVGDRAHATARTPRGLHGEEILVGDDHFARVPDAAGLLGTDRWIHLDLTDPRQRRHLAQNPVGLIELADLGKLRVGHDVAGQEVIGVERRGGRTVRLDLGAGRTIDVTTEPAGDDVEVRAPGRSEVVALADLPALAGGG